MILDAKGGVMKMILVFPLCFFLAVNAQGRDKPKIRNFSFPFIVKKPKHKHYMQVFSIFQSDDIEFIHTTISRLKFPKYFIQRRDEGKSHEEYRKYEVLRATRQMVSSPLYSLEQLIEIMERNKNYEENLARKRDIEALYQSALEYISKEKLEVLPWIDQKRIFSLHERIGRLDNPAEFQCRKDLVESNRTLGNLHYKYLVEEKSLAQVVKDLDDSSVNPFELAKKLKSLNEALYREESKGIKRSAPKPFGTDINRVFAVVAIPVVSY